jgi:diacylglycerol O-acyltransferase
MAAKLSRRLTAQDAAFLYFDSPAGPLHLGSLGIYEGAIRYDVLVGHLEPRIAAMPRYRQRVAFIPLNINHPTWEDDPNFSVRRHVRRVRPRGGLDDEGLRSLAAELFAQPLDRGKPLWDITLIEGLTGGRTALLSRAHHCMVDGISGIELLTALLDLTPTPAPPLPVEPWEPRPAPPPTTRTSEAFWDLLREQVEMWSDLGLLLVDGRERRRRELLVGRALGKAARFLLRAAPPTPFNAPLTPGRVIAWTGIPFADVRGIRSMLGGTVNDVVLTILTGALARYLDARSARDGSEAKPEELRVLVPVNVRREDQHGRLGNRVSFMTVTLPIAVPDPVWQLDDIREQTASLKRVNQAAGIELVLASLMRLPPPAQALIGAVRGPANSLANLVCTNVPGPMVPLYCVGHRMLEHYPLVPLGLHFGLNIAVTSYDQRLFFGVMAAAEAVPDPERIAEFLNESFERLRAAAGVARIELPRVAGRAMPAAAEAPSRPVRARKTGRARAAKR